MSRPTKPDESQTGPNKLPNSTIPNPNQVVLTRSDVVKGHPEYYQDLAARLAREAEAASGEPVLYIDQVGVAGAEGVVRPGFDRGLTRV